MRIRKYAYHPGKWLAVCDRCGFEYSSDQLQREWTGAMVCRGPGTNDCWEPRHPQDDLRIGPDLQSLPWTRPRPTDAFVGQGSWASGDVFYGGLSDTINSDIAYGGASGSFYTDAAYGGDSS